MEEKVTGLEEKEISGEGLDEGLGENDGTEESEDKKLGESQSEDKTEESEEHSEDGTESEGEDGEGVDIEAEVQKRGGVKNIFRENKRKSEEIKALKTALEAQKAMLTRNSDGQKAPELPNKHTSSVKPSPFVLGVLEQMRDKMSRDLKDSGLEDTEIKSRVDGSIKQQVDLVYGIVQDITKHMLDERFAPASKILFRDNLENSISLLKTDDKFKYPISKLEKEFREEIQKYDPSLWGDEIFAKSIMGNLIAEKHQELYKVTPKKQVRKISNTSAGGSGGTGDSFSDKEVLAYSLKHRLAADTPEDKKRIRQILAKRKAFLNSSEK